MKICSWLLLIICALLFPVVLKAQNCNNWAKITSSKCGIQIGDLDVSGNTITVEATFNRTVSYSGSQLYAGDLVSKHSDPNTVNYLLRPNSGEVTTTNGYFKTPDICDIQLNKTYHVAMVYDGSTLKFYRNGYLMSKIVCTGNLYQNDFTTTIGTLAADPNKTNENLVGYINEVRIWKVVRTQNEIRAYMNKPLPNPSSQNGLLAYYTFDNLQNKQGNAQWNGSVIGNASINQTNPTCNPFIADSCETKPLNVTANFYGPDTVCSNSPLQFNNTSVGASNYYWSFCSVLKTTPTAINFGNLGNQFTQPVFSDFGLDNGNYYSIVSNHTPGKITRLNFGNSLLNTPTVDDLGNFSGVVGNQTEGIQVLKVKGRWYAIIVGGGNSGSNSSPRIVKLDFGSSLSNTPVATNWGNIGTLDLPIDFQILQVNGNYYGFTMNVNSNTITRFDFGSDFINPPSAVNLGNIGNLDYPDGFTFINKNGNWYAFVVNNFSNAITRLDFGSNLTTTPTAFIIPNPGNLLNKPRDIMLLTTCNGIFGYALNSGTSNMIKLNFGFDITSSPTATDLGNLGNFNVPHSFSTLFTSGSGIYSFIPNAFNNTLARIEFEACENIPSSTQQNPGFITFTYPGVYTTNLFVDIGLPTQTSFCKQIVVNDCTPPVTATFTSPDTVCAKTSVNITNTSTNATNYTWSFCNTFKSTPAAANIGDPNNKLSTPVFIDYGLDDNGNYYGISTNHIVGKITRLNFGNSLLNSPTAEDLGNFGGVVPAQLEGIQVKRVNGKWYAIAVGGGNQLANSSPRIIKLDFGNSLANTPTITNWGNIGSLDLPIDFQILEEGGNYYGFAMNVLSNTITRFDFGNDFTNAPAAVNLGNIGSLDYPDGFTFVKYNNKWLAFVVNTYSNEITRLDFGSSLTSTPTATSITNPGNTLNAPRDITFLFTCESIYAYVVNANSNDIVKLNFGNDITSIPTAVNLGNIGNLNFPHSFSAFFSAGSNIYSFIPNVNSNTFTRIKFAGCQSIPGSNKQNPDPVIYDSAGLYTISLLVDVGLPTQTFFCKQIVVNDCGCDSFKINAGNDTSICYGSSVQLQATGAGIYNWNTSTVLSDTTIANPIANTLTTTQFIVRGYKSDSTCFDKDTVKVTVLALPVFSISNDTTICNGTNLQLNASAVNNYHYHWTPLSYLSDTSISNPISLPVDSIKYYVAAIDSNNCQSTDSVQINVVRKPIVSTINDSSICVGDTIILKTTAANATIFSWSPSAGINKTSVLSPQASPATSTKYIVSASNNVCAVEDSVLISVNKLPNISAGKDTTTCGTSSAQLQASGALTYRWQPTISLSNPNISNPVASPDTTTTYYVLGTDVKGCKKNDSVVVTKVPDPVFTIEASDSIVCTNQTVTLQAGGGDTYTWSPSQLVSDSSSANTIARPSAKTTFFVDIYNSTCKVSETLNTTVDVKSSPGVTLSKSNDIDCSNLQAQLNATGGNNYRWQPDSNINNTNISNPIVNPLSDTWYKVTVTGTNKCKTEDSILVKSSLSTASGNFYVPNAFTPNGDGINDCFGVHFWAPTTFFEMSIYNRWGQLVYYSRNMSDCWDGTIHGTKQASGTYVYMIKASSICSEGQVFRKGTVVLIR
jgi:gliding motility-associated-like protein